MAHSANARPWRLRTLWLFLSVLALCGHTVAVLQRAEPKVAIAQQNGLADGQSITGVDSPGCVKAPSCLEPSTTCLTSAHMVRQHLPECEMLPDYCSRSIYTLPSSGLRITLPIFDQRNLSSFYDKVYEGQCVTSFCLEIRPSQQAELIRKALGERTSGLQITEIGCASGALLRKLRDLAADGGKLECYEPDPEYNHESGQLHKMLRASQHIFHGLQYQVHPQLMDLTNVEENSIDVFAASHVVEHMTDPCPFLAGLYKALKPGGIVFIEVPHQYEDPSEQRKRGSLHLMFFNLASFETMMSIGGFEKVSSHDDNKYIRTVYRKPV